MPPAGAAIVLNVVAIWDASGLGRCAPVQYSAPMKRALYAACGLLGLIAPPAFARGVSPYLPLGIDPVIERQIERVLILADKPILTRPIAAATVLDALPVACQKDAVLCNEVRRYLAGYMRDWGVTELSVEASASSGATNTLPNRYGLTTDSNWNAAAQGFWQPYDHALISLGAVAYEGEVIPQGSLVSLGFDRAQLDIGYRAHWLSPSASSSMLLSTEAATMPSVTLSNYMPLTRWGIHYEAFVASMSNSDHILVDGDPDRSGKPRIAGVHLSMEPAAGWALGVNRLLQYGGAGRPSSFSDLLHAFFSPSKYDNVNTSLSSDQQFGNQVASFTSEFLFPGKVPFSVYFEYAGEDTSHGQNYLLGNSALIAGIHFPRLWQRFELTYEFSEWQNSWYVNAVYGDGLTNKGHVIGHWGADQRAFGDGVGAQSHLINLGWEPRFGGSFDLRLATLANESYSATPYEPAYNGTLSYSRPVGDFAAGVEVIAGRDVFGESFSRVGAFFRYSGPNAIAPGYLGDESTSADKTAELFAEAGVSANRLTKEPDENVFIRTNNTGAHVAFGARRAVSDRSDLGVRLELDDVDGHLLTSVRALDYRYRFANPFAISVFVGASRYNLGIPAYGLYLGGGVQWRDVMPGWDVGLDLRSALKVARDHLLPGDPQGPIRNDSFYTVRSLSLSLSRRF